MDRTMMRRMPDTAAVTELTSADLLEVAYTDLLTLIEGLDDDAAWLPTGCAGWVVREQGDVAIWEVRGLGMRSSVHRRRISAQSSSSSSSRPCPATRPRSRMTI